VTPPVPVEPSGSYDTVADSSDGLSKPASATCALVPLMAVWSISAVSEPLPRPSNSIVCVPAATVNESVVISPYAAPGVMIDEPDTVNGVPSNKISNVCPEPVGRAALKLSVYEPAAQLETTCVIVPPPVRNAACVPSGAVSVPLMLLPLLLTPASPVNCQPTL